MMHKVSEIYGISKELKNVFGEGRFSIDGLLMGDVGELAASYYYGIDLYQNGQKRHDGEVDGRKVQIKVSQNRSVDIKDKPDYLIVLFFDKDEKVFYEVYNGDGETAWECIGKEHNDHAYSMGFKRLIELNAKVDKNNKIEKVAYIEKLTV